MFDFKFLNADQIVSLRARGKVSASARAANLLSLSLSMIFFVSSLLKLEWSEMFNFDTYSDYLQILRKVLIVVISSLVSYIFLVIIITLLQTKFYFAASRIFSPVEPFFNISRSLNFLSFKTAAKSILFPALVFLSASFWLYKVPSSVHMLLSEDSYYALKNLVLILDELLFYCLAVFFIVAFVLIFIAKLAFRLDNGKLDEAKLNDHTA